MRLMFSLLLLLSLSVTVQAAPTGQISTFCKQQWPGQRGVQSFCIKENQNYYNWLQYIRKRLSNQPELLSVIDQCISDKQPDYKRAIDCYWDEVE